MKHIEAWRYAIAHYEKLQSEGADILPQLELTKKAAASKFGPRFFPISYAHALNLSAALDYEESLDMPSISVRYKGDNKFEISYLPNGHQTRNMTKTACHRSQSWTLLQSLFLRLDNESGK